jgi:hypothetical protein
MPQDYCLSRRHFVGAGAATLALATVSATESLFPNALEPYRAIYDERFAAGRQFAAVAAARGWMTRAIRGDVTLLWFHDLAVRWKHGPAAIVGLTTSQSLFVLERLAWDVRMRVIERHTDTTTHLVRWLISLPRAAGEGR